MEFILSAFVGLFLKMMYSVLKGERRLTGVEYAFSLVACALAWAVVWKWFCEQWASVAIPRLGDWLPACLVAFYYPWEIAVAPFLDGAILFTLIASFLKLLNYPEELEGDREGIAQWRYETTRKHLKRIGWLALGFAVYLCTSRGVVFLVESNSILWASH